jgi:hypothetical protein
VVSPPYQPLTVENLLKGFGESDVAGAVEHLKAEKGSKYFYRPQIEQSIDAGEVAVIEEVPGALICHYNQRLLIVVGDLHGNIERLKVLLDKYGALIRSGDAELVFLGDLIHPKTVDRETEMASSRQVLDVVIKLKSLYPDRVHLLLGDHDLVCTSEPILNGVVEYVFSREPQAHTHRDLSKFVLEDSRYYNEDRDKNMRMGIRNEGQDNVAQALEFLYVLCRDLKEAGHSREKVKEIVRKYQEFFDGCPLEMIVECRDDRGAARVVYLAHMPVVVGGRTKHGELNRQALIEARQDKDLLHQLLMNKPSQPGETRDFDESDVLHVIDELGLPRGATKVIGAHMRLFRAWHFRCFATVNNFDTLDSNVEGHFGGALIRNGEVTYEDIEVASTPAAAAA